MTGIIIIMCYPSPPHVLLINTQPTALPSIFNLSASPLPSCCFMNFLIGGFDRGRQGFEFVAASSSCVGGGGTKSCSRAMLEFLCTANMKTRALFWGQPISFAVACVNTLVLLHLSKARHPPLRTQTTSGRQANIHTMLFHQRQAQLLRHAA